MLMEEKQSLLIKHFPLFLESGLKKEIEEVAQLRRVSEGDILIDINESISIVPLVTRGTLKIIREDETGNELFLYYIEPGNTCAVSLTCCISKQKSSIRAVAEEDTEFLAIPLFYLDEWMVKYPSWKAFIMSTYAMRFDELLKTVDQIAFKKMDERLLKYLQDKAELHGEGKIHISHQEIANDLNTSREVISRLLKQIENQHKIRLGRNNIEILEL